MGIKRDVCVEGEGVYEGRGTQMYVCVCERGEGVRYVCGRAKNLSGMCISQYM